MTTPNKRVFELGCHILSSGVGQTGEQRNDRKHIKNKAEANIFKIYSGIICCPGPNKKKWGGKVNASNLMF